MRLWVSWACRSCPQYGVCLDPTQTEGSRAREALDFKLTHYPDAIAAGDYHPFTGPLNKQDGTAWLAEGETADDGTLLGMNFYVEGLEGDVPN